MVSLLVGMLLNVPVRALEYLAAMPALSGHVPQWLSTLQIAMTLDVVLLTSLYTIAFVAALRRVPLFPRLLVAIWLIDIAMQLGIAIGGRRDRRPAAAGRRCAAHAARRQRQEGADQRLPVAALFADVEAGQRHLPPPRRGVNFPDLARLGANRGALDSGFESGQIAH